METKAGGRPSELGKRREGRGRIWVQLASVGMASMMGFIITETLSANVLDQSPTIRIRVNNYSQASPATLTRAEREAERILGRAGLRIVWLERRKTRHDHD